MHIISVAMDDPQKQTGSILRALRSSPRGLSITEISRSIGLNRNSTAKYLDVLLYTGRIEVRNMGRAKLYYLSQRVPISALLDFSSDLIIGLDGQLRVIDANDNFLRFFNVKKDMLIDRKITTIDLPIFNTPEQISHLQNAVKGTDANLGLEIPLGEDVHFFRSKLIPTIMGDGKKGVTAILENVDEQKFAQRLVHESEMKFRAIYESAMDAMILTDNETFFECNDATKNMFGITDVEFIQKKYHFFSPPTQPHGEESQVILSRHMETARHNGLARFDWVHRRFDGTNFQTETIITPMNLYGKESLLIVIRDISERKEMESALREKEEIYRTLFESLPDAVMILEDGKVIQCNESTLKIFGVSSRDEIIGKRPSDLSPPFQPGGEVSRTMATRLLDEADEKGLLKFEWEHLRRGDPFLAEVSLVRTKLNDRPVIQATLRDVTELRYIQENLRQNEERLNNILSSLHGAFIGVMDENYVYQGFWGAQELDDIYGLKASQLVGRSALEFPPPDKVPQMKALIDRVILTGESVTFEVEGRLPSGTFFQDMTLSPYRTPNGHIQGVVQFSTDTTEKHRVLGKLKETERMYHLLDDNISDVIFMTDRELNFTYLSSSIKNLTGHDPKELIGKNVKDRITTASFDILMEGHGDEMRDLISGRRRGFASVKLEMDIIRKDGSTVLTEIIINVLTGPDRTPLGVIGISREIGRGISISIAS
ncbi:MAG: PAS domain S-box protein [Candidatus Thermoplasmatota archaeon]|nr:PAS domain S-box protein [Candidatus Thermoplasmatota archaeon]